jgi:hypothetical protein
MWHGQLSAAERFRFYPGFSYGALKYYKIIGFHVSEVVNVVVLRCDARSGVAP